MVRDPGVVWIAMSGWLERYHQIPDAKFDVRCMIEQVAGESLEQAKLHGISYAQEQAVIEMAERRANGEPLQYILGEWEFFGMRMFVGKGVLIPRPDTEILVETVLEKCKTIEKPRIIDLCTGSGCIALALRKNLPDSEVHALDLSKAALAYAQRNIRYHGLPVTLHQADVLDARKPQESGTFDIIVSNPPYLTSEEMEHLQPEIRHEPASALAAGADGLEFYRGITNVWKTTLSGGGWLAFEIGEQQGNAVAEILKQQGFREIQIIPDYAHHDRVVIGRNPLSHN